MNLWCELTISGPPMRPRIDRRTADSLCSSVSFCIREDETRKLSLNSAIEAELDTWVAIQWDRKWLKKKMAIDLSLRKDSMAQTNCDNPAI